MTYIILDGEKMTNKKIAHLYMKEKLSSLEYHGENLDALWDILSTYDRNIEVKFINIDKLIDNLGDYGEAILAVFKEAQEENSNIIFKKPCNSKYI